MSPLLRRIRPRPALVAAAAFALVMAVLSLDPGRPRAAGIMMDEGHAVPARLGFMKGKPAIGIPVRVLDHHLWTRGAIDRSDSLWILFDTGARRDCIRATRAEELELPTRGRGRALQGGGAETEIARDVEVGLPGLRLRQDRLVSVPLEDISAQAGRSLDLILGYPLFVQAVVVIDYERGSIDVHDPERWQYHGTGTVLPLTLENRVPYVVGRVTLPGRQAVEGRFIIDTGSIANLTLSRAFVEKQRALESIPKTVVAAARASGSAGSPVGRIERLELGDLAIERPIATLRPADPPEGAAAGWIGNIGGGVLGRFRVILDYAHGRMILEPNARLGEPFEYDMSGIGLVAAGPRYERMMVARVLEDSPAADIGIAVGDQITTVDGRPTSELGLDGLREMFRRDGEEHRLEVRRNGKTFDYRLKTRRMI